MQLVVDPRAVGLLLEEQCQRVQPDLPSRGGYQPLVYLDSLDTHPVVAVGVGEEELVRGHGAALALDAVEPDACAHRDHHLAPCPLPRPPVAPHPGQRAEAPGEAARHGAAGCRPLHRSHWRQYHDILVTPGPLQSPGQVVCMLYVSDLKQM